MFSEGRERMHWYQMGQASLHSFIAYFNEFFQQVRGNEILLIGME